MPSFLDTVLEAAKSAGAGVDSGTTKIEGFLADLGAVTKSSADLMQTAAQDAALVSTTTTAAALDTQHARQLLGLDFGTDRNAQNQIYSALAETEKVENQKQLAAKATIDQKESVRLEDNPLQYIMNQFTINGDIRAHNAALGNRQAALDRIDALNAATLGSTTLQAQFSNVITVASAEASARLAATGWKDKANEYTAKGLVYNIEGVKAAMEADKTKLSYMFQAESAIKAAGSLAVSQQMLKLHQDEFDFRKQEKLKSDQFDSSIVESINYGRAARGLPPLIGVKANTALMMLKSKGPMADELSRDWKAGESFQASGQVVLADSPADMLGLLNSGTVVSLPPMQLLVKDKLSDALTMAKNSKGYDPKTNPSGAITALNSAARAVVENDAREVKPGDANNLFSIAPINQIVKTSSAAAETPVYQKVLKPLMDKGVDMSNPNAVVSAVVGAMQAGTITYPEALSTVTIYQAGAAANLEARDLRKFGLEPVYKYNARISGVGDFGSSSIVDLTKVDTFGRMINKLLGSEAFRKNFPTDYTSGFTN